MEKNLCVARLDSVQARGAGVVRVSQADVCGQGGGDHVPVADDPASSADVDPVGEGFGDRLAAEAGLRQFRGEG
ncbi:hypothetical protein ACFWBS_19250 [Streptomyces mirabilis]|uniref:hypothetical protein n=1 Tax=Streptomyces mirabilis TaxID=68239 RepID=UPI00365D8072